jgi:hypothetical protein
MRCAIPLLCALGAACASSSSRREVPAVRFEPVTSGEPAAVRRQNEDRLAAAKERFRDLDPKAWSGGGPWWISSRARLVPYLDGQTVLVAVGESKYGDRAAAAERARAEAGRAFQAVVARLPRGRGGERPLPSEARLRQVEIDAFFDRGGRTWALALCDRGCLEASGRASRVSLSSVALAPGEP